MTNYDTNDENESLDDVPTDRDRRQSVHLELPRETYELLKEQSAPMWQATAESIHSSLGGEYLTSVPAIEREIEQHRRKVRTLTEEKNDIAEEIDRHEQRLADLKDHLHTLEEQQSTVEDKMDVLLDQMTESGMHVYPDHTRVSELARFEYGKTDDETQQQLLDDLQERAAERDLDLPPEQFAEYDNGGGW